MMPRNSEALTSVTSDRWLLPEVRHGEAADDPLDFLALDMLLSSEEKSVRARTRKFIADELEPHISEWFQGRVPIRELGREFGRRGFFGSLIGSSNDTPPAVSFGLSMLEFEAADTGLRQFISTQDNLVMFALARYGSPEQSLRMAAQAADRGGNRLFRNDRASSRKRRFGYPDVRNA
jgi:alkylation response protein AidB-like acyl-CoA dehydrogenase